MGQERGQAWMRWGAVLVIAVVVLGVVVVVRSRLDADPSRAFLAADAAFRAGHVAEARRILRRLERLRRPTSADRLLRGQVARGLSEPDEAMAEWAAIPDANPLAPLARVIAGQLAISRGLTRPAEANFKEAIRLLPEATKPRRELVYIYNIQHRQAELDRVLGELLELDTLEYPFVLHWTKTRNTVWNPNGDLPVLRKFVAADPEDRWSRLALAEALRRLDRPDEAVATLAPLPDSDPEARVERVLLAMGRGDFTASDALLAGGPADHPGLARLRGQLALRNRDSKEAARQFRIALAADPIDRVALQGLGTALGSLGHADEARGYLEAARRHDVLWPLVARAATNEGEHDPRLPHQLGLACAAIGRTLEARAWLRLAVSRDPGDQEGQKALYRLEHPASNRSEATGPVGLPPSKSGVEPQRLTRGH